MHRGSLRTLWGVAATALITILAATPISAQDRPGEVSGRVVNSRDNEPLSQVRVELSGTSLVAVTAADGSFSFRGVPAGTYVLQATSVGYA